MTRTRPGPEPERPWPGRRGVAPRASSDLGRADEPARDAASPVTTITSSRPSVGSIGWRGPTRPGMIWPQFATRTTRPLSSWTLAVGLDPERDRPQPGGLAERGDDVGREPQPALQLGRRAGHDAGVEADARRRRRTAFDPAAGPGCRPSTSCPTTRGRDRPRRGCPVPIRPIAPLGPARDPERGREHVAGSRRHDRERDAGAGQRRGRLADRAVAADDARRAAPPGACSQRERLAGRLRRRVDDDRRRARSGPRRPRRRTRRSAPRRGVVGELATPSG